MRTLARALAVFALGTAALSAAEPGTWGAGVILGDPTGISVKRWLENERAIVGALAWSLGDNDSLQVHGDYIRHTTYTAKDGDPGLPLYYGLGLRFRFDDEEGNRRGRDEEEEVRAGIRIPLGLRYEFPRDPFEVFAEIAPGLDLVPDADLEIDGAIGVRYLFR